MEGFRKYHFVPLRTKTKRSSIFLAYWERHKNCGEQWWKGTHAGWVRGERPREDQLFLGLWPERRFFSSHLIFLEKEAQSVGQYLWAYLYIKYTIHFIGLFFLKNNAIWNRFMIWLQKVFTESKLPKGSFLFMWFHSVTDFWVSWITHILVALLTQCSLPYLRYWKLFRSDFEILLPEIW